MSLLLPEKICQLCWFQVFVLPHFLLDLSWALLVCASTLKVGFLLCSVEQISPARLIRAGTSPVPLNAFASALFVKISIHFTPVLILKVLPFQWREPMFVVSLCFGNKLNVQECREQALPESLSAWGCVVH